MTRKEVRKIQRRSWATGRAIYVCRKGKRLIEKFALVNGTTLVMFVSGHEVTRFR